MATAKYRDSNGDWKAWSPDMVGIAANANTFGGGSYVPKAAYGVVDYNNTGQTVTIGYAGNGFSASDFTYALGLNTSRQIKNVSKSEYQKWLGLGSLAYKSSLSYSDVGAAASSHTHSGMITTSNISSYNAGGTNFYVATKGNVSLSSSSSPTALCSITLPAGYGWLITASIDYINAGSNGCCLSIYENNAVGNSVDTVQQAYAGYCSITTSYIGKTNSGKSDTLILYGRVGGSGGGTIRRATIQAVQGYKY